MNLIIILASIAATTHIVILSYAFSFTFRELYKEPLFLKCLMLRLGNPLSEDLGAILRWFVHYFAGFLFVVCFYVLLEYDILDLSWSSGLQFGLISGLISVEWWHKMLGMSNFPRVDSRKYYRQLLCVHIVFGITVVGVFKLLL